MPNAYCRTPCTAQQLQHREAYWRSRLKGKEKEPPNAKVNTNHPVVPSYLTTLDQYGFPTTP